VIRLSSFQSSKRRNPVSKLAQIPGQSEITYSAYLLKQHIRSISSDLCSRGYYTKLSDCLITGPPVVVCCVMSSCRVCVCVSAPRENRHQFLWVYPNARLHHLDYPDHQPEKERHLGLYTILPSLILYGVWHKQGGSVAGRRLRNGRPIVLQ